MRIRKNMFWSTVILILCATVLFSQEHDRSKDYQKPKDPLVLENLDKWQDLKFGLMMHWGPYSQWGVVESWSICPEDEDWTQRDKRHGETYNDYLANYENLQRSFNPVRFNPDKWASAAKKAGMKYVVFTTKHHDGFAMFDTQESDYKITSDRTPFSSNEKADITHEIFESFRDRDFMIGAYFSKPDWHSNYYWWDYFPPLNRNVNYSVEDYPDRWNKFKEFTFNQLNEITTQYGKVDILWLDGGWVSPRNNQDIDMDKIGTMARKNQPGIIVVDRTIPGRWENYVTPEQTVPEKALDIPWESVISMGNSFSYVPGDHYKSPQKIINSLIQIISRGGNYLLNIAPGPDGDFDDVAYDRLKSIGDWMTLNGEAVYRTRSIEPYQDEEVYYTTSKEKDIVNAFHIAEEGEYTSPAELRIKLPVNFIPQQVKVLGISEAVDWQKKGRYVEIKLPKSRTNLQYATVVQLIK